MSKNMFEGMKKDLDKAREVEKKWNSDNERCKEIQDYCLKALKEFRKIFLDAVEILKAYPEMGRELTEGSIKGRIIGRNYGWAHKMEKIWFSDEYFNQVNHTPGMLFSITCTIPLGCEYATGSLEDYDQRRNIRKEFSITTLERIDNAIEDIETRLQENIGYEDWLYLQNKAEETKTAGSYIIAAMEAEMEEIKKKTKVREEKFNRSIKERNVVYKKILD